MSPLEHAAAGPEGGRCAGGSVRRSRTAKGPGRAWDVDRSLPGLRYSSRRQPARHYSVSPMSDRPLHVQPFAGMGQHCSPRRCWLLRVSRRVVHIASPGPCDRDNVRWLRAPPGRNASWRERSPGRTAPVSSDCWCSSRCRSSGRTTRVAPQPGGVARRHPEARDRATVQIQNTWGQECGRHPRSRWRPLLAE